MYKISKRNKTIQDFDLSKIKNVVYQASRHFVNEEESNNISQIVSNEILNDINKNYKDGDIIDIEEIQNLVEKTLMKNNYYEIMKHYIIYREQRNFIRNKEKVPILTQKIVDKIANTIDIPWGPIGYIVYKRTYARIKEDGNLEEFKDTIQRVLNACQTQLKVNFTQFELEKAFRYFLELKCSVAGRFLWQLGTKTVDKLGIASTQNCAFVNIDNSIECFTWIFDMLMLGCGVGFNIQRNNINKIPVVLDTDIKITRYDEKDADFIIPDSREGWVKLLEEVLKAYFVTGKSFTYSTILIRGKGALIRGFGGISSGPDKLCEGIDSIANILNKQKGKKLSSIDCLDIVNIIATIVVSGNVRRCLPKGSLIHTKNGLVKIENIKINDEVLTSKGYYKVNNIFNQGIQNLITIKTENGIFKCTKNHKMAVYKDTNNYIWKKAKDLTKNDLLMTTRQEINGYNNLCIHINQKSEELIESEISEEDLAWIIGIYQKTGIDLETLINITNKFDNNKYIYNFITSYFENNKFFKTIPDFIYESTTSIKLAYLAGIIDGIDGNIKNTIVYDKSLKWIQELQNLCYSCGFETTVEKSINENYDLKITTKYAKNIIELIPQIIKVLEFDNLILKDTNDLLKYNLVKVLRIEDNNDIDETFDIEVDTVHEFYCNGYLTHNSALLCIGDYDDIDYLKAKRWDIGTIPNWRCMSNNSVDCNDITKLPQEFWDGYEGKGEPYGLINIELSKKIGRLHDGNKYPDPLIQGYNPCLVDTTWILTTYGLIQIKDLIGKKFTAIINGKEYSSTDKGFWLSGKKNTYMIQLDNGCEIEATNNHKFKTINGWKEVKDLNVNDDIFLSNNINFKWENKNSISNIDGYLYGYNYNNVKQKFNRIDFKLFESYDFTLKFIKGLFDNSSKIDFDKNKNIIYITIYIKDIDVIKYLQILLLSLNIYTYVDTNKLIIKNYEVIKFNSIIGFDNINKDEKLNNLIKRLENNYNKTELISKVKFIKHTNELKNVYDCTIPNIDCFSANGIISHNCCEQGLANHETCCLAEIFLPNIHSYNELKEIATYLYKICKKSLLLPCHHKKTEDIVHSNMRMGIGITGFLQTTQEQKDWLDPLYNYIRELDYNYSKENNLQRSVKITTIKPSGTLSLLPGVTPGAHAAIFKYYIRRVRINTENDLVKLCRNKGYNIEYQKNFDKTLDYTTSIIEFPCKSADNAILAKNMTAIDELEVIKKLQTIWSDNSVSCTIYYRKEELDVIKEWLKKNYTNNVKTVSFLLHYDHCFEQAPYEEISEEKYNELIKNIQPITTSNINDFGDIDNDTECKGGVCPIR